MADRSERDTRPDLADLVQRAGDEIARQRPAASRPRDRLRWLKPLATAVVVLCLAWSGYELSPWFVGFTEDAIREGLVTAAQVARQEVEDYRHANGALPEQLPDPALALFIDYERSGGGYRLRATDGAVFVVVDERGTVAEGGKR